MVLSQPPISTTASSGSAEIISSTSIAIRFRSSIEVGKENASCSETVGNTNGSAPAIRTPRDTASASCGAVLWQGLKSEAVDRMPTIGRSSASSVIARAFEKAAPQEQREFLVAVLGEAGPQAFFHGCSPKPKERTDVAAIAQLSG